MPVATTYPGVYIEEIPSGVRTITGVATSIAAFIGFFERGMMNQPVQIFNMGDFARKFGGLHLQSEASYAIQQFFLNGGTEAWVVRTASGPVAAADVQIQASIDGATALTIQAGQLDPTSHPHSINPGMWGDNLRVRIDYPMPTSGDRFNMTVFLVEARGGREVVIQSEQYLGLTMSSIDTRFVQTVVNDRFTGSKLIRVSATGNDRPLQNGTISGVLDPFDAKTITNNPPQVNVSIGTDGSGIATLSRVPATLADVRTLLESAIRGARPDRRAFSEASVSIVDNRLRILAGPTESTSRITFGTAGTDATLSTLGLSPGTPLEGILSGDVSSASPHGGGQLQATIGAVGPITLTLAAMADLASIRNELETQIRGADGSPEFSQARVTSHSEGGVDRVVVLAGSQGSAVSFTQEGGDTTVSDLMLNGAASTAIAAVVSNDLSPVPAIAAGSTMNLTVGAEGPHLVTIAAAANVLADIASELQSAIRSADATAAFSGARVAAYDAGGEHWLVVLGGIAGDAVVFTTAPLDGTTVSELLLDSANAQVNVQSYALGAGAAIANTAQGAGTPGNDGALPDGTSLIGDLNSKTGLFAFEDVDLFNILCIPRAAIITGANALSAPEASAVMSAAISYCERRRAFFIMDTPTGIDEVQEVKDWLESNDTLRHRNTALYFPRIQVPDPLNEFRPRSIGASGAIAGLFARTDSDRGVWKAPAGTEARLRNVQGYDYSMTDSQNGTLNPIAINCLRNFPVYGNVCWGARTLDGSDQQASEWKYVPVRRLALFLEESLYRGTKWVVFEPNDEPLWSQIRLNIGTFMHNLFRQGAFQGSTPRDAYLVKCDKETTIQNDINNGTVNIIVGFAPLKPAEFVIIKIQQMAGQIEM